MNLEILKNKAKDGENMGNFTKQDLEKFRNKFVVLEGPDHTGSTTISKLLNQELNENGIPSIYTFEPGDNDGKYNQVIHDMCKTKKYDLDPLSNLFAFLLDRSEHTAKKIIPALKEGKVVISDRFWHSTIAYQFYGKQLLKRFDLSRDFAYWMNKVASHNLSPHHAFFLQRPEELVKAHENDKQDLFETESDKFKNRVKEGYNSLIVNGDLTVINVDPDPIVTLTNIISSI